jgi:hypothetical protein
MKLPLILMPDLPEWYWEKWQTQFVRSGRQTLEGLWRRTQDPCNARLSGYQSKMDKRKKIIHFIDNYNVVAAEAGYYNLNAARSGKQAGRDAERR